MSTRSGDPSGPLDSPHGPRDLTGSLVNIAEGSAQWRSGIDRLRDLAAGRNRNYYARTTGPLTTHKWNQLEDLAHEGSADNRDRAWKRGLWTDRTDDGHRHVRDYLRGCRTLADRHLRDARLAEAVHQLVCGTGYMLKVPSELRSDKPPLEGSVASAVNALWTGASHAAGATALRQQMYRHLPPYPSG